jgi:hypothetical protein
MRSTRTSEQYPDQSLATWGLPPCPARPPGALKISIEGGASAVPEVGAEEAETVVPVGEKGGRPEGTRVTEGIVPDRFHPHPLLPLLSAPEDEVAARLDNFVFLLPGKPHRWEVENCQSTTPHYSYPGKVRTK